MTKPFLLALVLVSAPLPATACEAVEGLRPLLEPGSVLLLGEMHGTAESPAFVGRAACLVHEAGRAVTVALEIPVQEEPLISAYLSSPGEEKDRAALLKGAFWADSYQDGRRSRAMLALLEELRKLRRQGSPVHVALLDTTVPPADGRSRDHVMADNLKAAAEASPQDVVIALTGNLHSRVTLGSPWNPKYEPMGYFFTQAEPQRKVTALDVAYSGGTAWTCESGEAASCKERALGGEGDEKGVRVIPHPLEGGFHGVYNVGRLTASPPAVQGAPAGTSRQGRVNSD
jgi:hypothetical protein